MASYASAVFPPPPNHLAQPPGASLQHTPRVFLAKRATWLPGLDSPSLLRSTQLRGKQVGVTVLPQRNKRVMGIQATADASRGKSRSNNDILMVDPLEAKRLAAKQMEEIRLKETFKRRRQIEAVNGVWAVLGLTAGLVIEGCTGKSFLAQLLGYWDAAINFFSQ